MIKSYVGIVHNNESELSIFLSMLMDGSCRHIEWKIGIKIHIAQIDFHKLQNSAIYIYIHAFIATELLLTLGA